VDIFADNIVARINRSTNKSLTASNPSLIVTKNSYVGRGLSGSSSPHEPNKSPPEVRISPATPSPER